MAFVHLSSVTCMDRLFDQNKNFMLYKIN